MKIRPYIFNWKGQLKKTIEKENQLFKYQPVVINSDDENERDYWENVGDDAYYGAQFITAWRHFLRSNDDVMFLIQADASSNEWSEMILEAESDFRAYSWGIYAPDVDFTHWNSYRTDIPHTSFAHRSHLQLVACPDCTCWMIHRDILEHLDIKEKLYNLNLSSFKLGFGFDILICALSHHLNRPVIRNYKFQVDHPQGTGYNLQLAHSEFFELWNRLPPHLLELNHDIYRNPEHLKHRYPMYRTWTDVGKPKSLTLS